jgi:hypothetical protein
MKGTVVLISNLAPHREAVWKSRGIVHAFLTLTLTGNELLASNSGLFTQGGTAPGTY